MNVSHKLTNQIIANIFTLLADQDIDASPILETKDKQEAYKSMREAILHFVFVNRG